MKSPALEELKKYDQWVAWDYITRDGKPTKVPLRLDGQGNASATDPATWATWAVAEAAKRRGTRLGFVFTADDPFCGIDLDDCILPDGTVRPEAQAIIDHFYSYTEVTPSGKGVHIWIKGRIEGTRHRKGNVEVYDRDRFFSITGDRLVCQTSNSDTINDRQADLTPWYAQTFPATNRQPTGKIDDTPAVRAAETEGDGIILDRAFQASNGETIRQLYRGNLAGYDSYSEAVAAFIWFMAFYTRDPTQLDRLFRASALYASWADKWERLGQREIDRALEGVTELHSPSVPVINRTAPADEPEPQARPVGIASVRDLDNLLASDVKPIKLIIPDWLPVGATIFAGAPKTGKSYAALQMALAVGKGGKVFQRYPVEPGPVLYLALEDGDVRMFHRTRQLLGDGAGAPGVAYATEWPIAPEGGLAQIETWLQRTHKPRMVIIDTLKRFRPPSKGRSVYEEDYDAISGLQRLSIGYGVAMLIIHHTRKAGADDIMAEINGSYGLTGSADTTIIVKRKRLSSEGAMTVLGRDIEDQTINLTFENVLWTATDARGVDVKTTEKRTQVLEAFRRAGGRMTVKMLSDVLDIDYDAAKQMMYRMLHDGDITRTGRGTYILVDRLQ